MYSVRVSLYLNLTQCFWISGFLPYWDPEVMSLSPPRSYHQDLKKKLVEKLPYFNTTIYRCCYTHVSLITTKSTLQRCLVLPWPGSATVPNCTRLTQSSRFCFPLGAEGASSIHLFSGFSNAVQIQSNTAVVVVWMMCPALVTHTLKTPLFQENSNHKCRNVSPSHVHHCHSGMS